MKNKCKVNVKLILCFLEAAYHYNEALRSPKHESARNNNGRNKTGIFKELCLKFRDVQPRRQWKGYGKLTC